MQRIPSTRAQETAPRTRLGGPVSFRGQTYATTAELEEALAGAVEHAGATRWRLTRQGWEAAAQLQAARGERS